MAASMSDGRLKFIQDRIGKVELQFGDICRATSAYVRHIAKLRDKGDDLAKAMLSFAQSETLNLTTKTALIEFVENFAAVEDYRNVQIQRLDAKVVEPMLQYGVSCRRAKERIKDAFATHAKEMKQRSDKTTSKTAKDHMGPETVQQGITDALRANRDLEDEIDSFERKKLHDVKTLMSDFVNVELAFHSKALEMFTLCYRSMTTIREDHDLQQYRESMRPLIKPASQTDQLGNASNSSSVGRTMSMTSRFFEVFGKKQKGRREPTQNSHNINEATTTPHSPPPHSPPPHSPPPSFLYNPLSQNEESDGFTEDSGANASGEDETSETSDEELKQRRK